MKLQDLRVLIIFFVLHIILSPELVFTNAQKKNLTQVQQAHLSLEKLCVNLSNELDYDTTVLFNDYWTSVYEWSNGFLSGCHQLQITIPTREEVRYYFYGMRHHLAAQPDWKSAAFIMKMHMQNQTNSMLLFRKRNATKGSFHIVPKMNHYQILEPTQLDKFPLFSIDLKILYAGDTDCPSQVFLFYMMCKVGVSMYTRVDLHENRQCPSQQLINKVIRKVSLPGGSFNCRKRTRKMTSKYTVKKKT